MTHHDLAQLPNGNVLMIACEKKYLADLLAAGFRTNAQTDLAVRTDGGFLLPDYIIEVRPDAKDGTTNGTIVWEWHVMDHLIQDYDATKANYGVVSNHVELINANAGTPGKNILMDVAEKYPGYTHVALRVASMAATIAAPIVPTLKTNRSILGPRKGTRAFAISPMVLRLACVFDLPMVAAAAINIAAMTAWVITEPSAVSMRAEA